MYEMVHHIAQKTGTPFYLYDTSIIRRQWDTLHTGKPERLKVYYAIKGNPSIEILRYFKKLGAGVEIASGGELFLALKAGFSPEDILFTGPGKTDAELEFAVQTGIKSIHVESIHEARRLQSICYRLDKQQSILVRINARMEADTQVRFSGYPSPFGISEEDILQTLPEILRLSRLSFQGIHVYNASGILDYRLLIDNVIYVFDLILKLEKALGIHIPVIDFGGGLGVDYSDANKQVDVPSFYEGFRQLIGDYGFQDRNFVLEIARYLMAESGSYITSILDKKYSRGKHFLIVDGGIHHFMRTALFGTNHSARILRPHPAEEEEIVQVTGCLCTSIDHLLKDVLLPKADIGDYLLIRKTGCYSLSAAMNHFLSHEMPAEVLLEHGKWWVIRQRGQYEDLLLNQT